MEVFKLNLDMALYFLDPMIEQGKGIRVTQEIELPFPPQRDIFINGVALNGDAISMGFMIEELTWDIDRKVFFGLTRLTSVGVPIAIIPFDIRSWMDRGWRFGSYEDTYGKPDGRSNRATAKPIMIDWDPCEEDVVARWPQMSSRKRPAVFNVFVRALAREMVKLGNNTEVAYAMAKTGMYFTEAELKENEGASARRYKQALDDFARLDFSERGNWERSVIRRYPQLEQFLH